MSLKNTVILIPSLEPDERLPKYVTELLENGFGHVVVIDDGSSAVTQPIFDRIAEIPGTAVLHHEVNKGKGAGLRTGYRYVLESIPEATGIITADADGQHAVKDCITLAEKLEEYDRILLLGSRDFSLPDVPKKSRYGNRITSAVFKLLYGVWLPDTQTGLRAFKRCDLAFMADVEGDRYEYEMNVLIACARAGIPMKPVTIDTIYENDNAGSHFHPFRDGWRIYKVIFGNFFRFAASSILCWMIDQGLFNLLYWVLLKNAVPQQSLEIVCTYAARAVSAVINYFLNRNIVFKSGVSIKKTLRRYIVLCVSIATVSGLCVAGLEKVGINPSLAKIVVDMILYLVSYRFQQNWVFNDGKNESEAKA